MKIMKAQKLMTSLINEVEKNKIELEKEKQDFANELKKYKNGTFIYHNYLAVIADEFTPELQWETQDYEWVEYGRWPAPLHFGLEYLIEVEGMRIKKLIEAI